jgi:predicted nucleotidyltransferase
MTPSTIHDEVIEHITRTIVERFHPRRIILFGSRARGEGQPDSDYDVLVEMSTDLPFHERLSRVYEAFGLRQVLMDVLVFTPEEMAEERRRVFSVAKIAEREGTVLYDAA